MANPIGQEFRGPMLAVLGDVYNALVVAYGAVDNAGEDTYTITNRATMISNLDSARDAVLAVIVANNSGNP